MSLCVICRRTTTASACQPCITRISITLGKVIGWYDALEDVLIPSQGGGSDDVRVRTSKVHPPLPMNLHVLNLRSRGGIATTLHEWAADLREQRGADPIGASGDLRRMLVASVTYLSAELPWAMTQYERMRDLADAVDWVEGTCMVALGMRQKVRYIGTCPEILDDHQECGRSLRVSPDDIAIKCPCGTTWPRTRWIYLATALKAGA